MSAFHPGQWQKNAAQCTDYFAEMMSDYLQDYGKEVGVWGKDAQALGLYGCVQLEHFERLVKGLHPKTQKPLTQRQRGDRRCYLGSVLSAPKSFSIAAVIGKDERLVTLFRQSVDETLDTVVNQYAAVRVRSGGRDDTAPGKGLIHARFIHDLSRELDPALHAHATVFNCTQDADGQWKALQSEAIFERRTLFSEVLLGKLARGARELGYNIEQSTSGFEIKGIEADVRDRLSKGKSNIDAAAKEMMGSDEKGHAAVRAVLAHKVRKKKEKNLAADELHKRWKEELGDDHQKILDLVAEARQRKPIRTPQRDAGELVRTAVLHLTERQSVVRDHAIEAEALATARGQVELTAVRAALDKDISIISGPRDAFGSRKITTQELLQAESEILKFARMGTGVLPVMLPEEQRRNRSRDQKLGVEQRGAVDTLLASKDCISILVGKAGTGKSTSQKDLVEGLTLGGHTVIGCAPQARQVHELRAMGLGESQTLASVLIREELPPQAVVLLDEAGQVGTRDLHQLVQMVQAADGRLIMSGDPRQHGSVPAGDMLRLLLHQTPTMVARITHIRRQKPEDYRKIVEQLSRHQTLSGLDMLERSGRVVEVEGEARREELARWAADGIVAQKDVLCVAPTWKEIDRVTKSLREELSRRGKITGGPKTASVLERLDLTMAQVRQTRHYEPGMELLERRGLGLPEKRLVVKKVDGDKLVLQRSESWRPDYIMDLNRVRRGASWTVYRPREIEVRVGDRLLLQENSRSKCYTNGDLVEVTGLEGSGIELKDGRILGPDYRTFTHGWAVTSQSSQGLTADMVAASYDQASYGAIDRRGFYVAMSRGREDARVFTDDKQFLRDTLRKNSGERETATELVAKGGTQKDTNKQRALLAARTAAVRQSLEQAKQPAKSPIFWDLTHPTIPTSLPERRAPGLER